MARASTRHWWGVAAICTLTACALAIGLWLVPAPGAFGAAAKPPAPKPPGVYTGTPQASPTQVTFKGSVNPRGLQTVYAFQFGTTTGYGAQTAPAPAGNGTTSIPVSQVFKGLTPGVTYHCRLIATNSVGTTNGQDVAFTIKVPLTFKLTVTPNPVVYGSPLTLSGTLSGTGSTGRDVVLQANPFPYLGGFKTTTAPVATSTSGAFSFPVANLVQTTQFRIAVAGVAPIYSRAVVERVAARVNMRLASTGRTGFVRMYGTVAPAQSGARVAIQLMRPGVGWRTVAGAALKRASMGESSFSRTVRIRRRGLYRAYVQVDNGKLVAGHSRPILVR